MALQIVLQTFQNTPLLWVCIALPFLGLIFSTRWFKGLAGELLVRSLLSLFLSRKDYRVLHNLILKTPDGSAQIDHIVISPFGLFVIETKNMKGWIFGDANSRTWTQSLFGKKFSFQNPLRQNYKHVKAVESILGINPEAIHSIIVFTGFSTFKTAKPQNVVRPGELATFIKSRKAVLFNRSELDSIAASLTSPDATLSGMAANYRHVQSLKENAKQPHCPRCGTTMTLRIAKKGKNIGGQFWGCSNFPKCRSTKSLLGS